MAKDRAERLTQTYLYIKNTFGTPDHDRIKQGISQQNLNADTVSDALSLGGVRGPEIFQSNTKTAQRSALRSLLLANLAIGGATLADLPRLRENFKNMTEHQLRGEVDYVLDYLDSALVAHNVSLAAENAPGNTIKWGRAGGANCMTWQVGTAETSPLTCYSSVIYWAFQGRAISKRFLKRWEHVNTLLGANAHNGMGALMKVDEAIKVHGIVGEGLTIFFQTPINKLGHTVLSLGGGRIASCNGVTPPPDLADETLKPGTVWNKMAMGEYHLVMLQDLQRIYKAEAGYTYTAMTKPFWEYYPISER